MYQRIESLRAYVIVQQDDRRVDRFWLDEENLWCHAIHTVANSGLRAPVPCPETALTLAEIYARTE